MNLNTDSKIIELKKKISSLEWDIPNIKNEVIKNHKIRLIQDYKSELSKIVKSKEKSIVENEMWWYIWVKETVGKERIRNLEKEELDQDRFQQWWLIKLGIGTIVSKLYIISNKLQSVWFVMFNKLLNQNNFN